jgi:hypothetical protein
VLDRQVWVPGFNPLPNAGREGGAGHSSPSGMVGAAVPGPRSLSVLQMAEVRGKRVWSEVIRFSGFCFFVSNIIVNLAS